MVTYSIVLFDLDGTLTDPKVGITKSVQYALAKFGIHEPDLDQLTPFIGPPLQLSFQEKYGMTASEAKMAVEYYREYFKPHGIYENRLYDGIPSLLQSLKDASRQLVLATSKPTVFAEEILRHFDMGHFFDHVVGSHLDGTRTAKAEVIRDAMGHYVGVQNANFVMVGDREHDVIGANQNGVDSIGVTYGYGSLEELRQAEATYTVDSVHDLSMLLKG